MFDVSVPSVEQGGPEGGVTVLSMEMSTSNGDQLSTDSCVHCILCALKTLRGPGKDSLFQVIKVSTTCMVLIWFYEGQEDTFDVRIVHRVGR
jgi:hypothetical protein